MSDPFKSKLDNEKLKQIEEIKKQNKLLRIRHCIGRNRYKKIKDLFTKKEWLKLRFYQLFRKEKQLQKKILQIRDSK